MDNLWIVLLENEILMITIKLVFHSVSTTRPQTYQQVIHSRQFRWGTKGQHSLKELVKNKALTIVSALI